MLIEIRKTMNNSTNIVINIGDNTYRTLGYETAIGAPPNIIKWILNTRFIISNSTVINSYGLGW